jgi:hypothetical protein
MRKRHKGWLVAIHQSLKKLVWQLVDGLETLLTSMVVIQEALRGMSDDECTEYPTGTVSKGA